MQTVAERSPIKKAPDVINYYQTESGKIFNLVRWANRAEAN